jgi:hypothetical protein
MERLMMHYMHKKASQSPTSKDGRFFFGEIHMSEKLRLQPQTNITVIQRDSSPSDQAVNNGTINPRYKIHRTDGLKHGPVFIDLPTSRVMGESPFLSTPRGRNAARRAVETPAFTDPKLSGARLVEVEKVERFARVGESDITLSRDFPLQPDSESYLSRENILGRLRRSTFLTTLPEGNTGRSVAARFIRAVAEHSKEDTYWDNEGKKLSEQFNRASYQRITNEYGNREPEDFFSTRMGDASRIIGELITNKLPSERRTWGLLTETPLISSPAKLVRLALSADTEERLQYEVLRTLNVAELLAKNGRHTKGLKPFLDDFQSTIDNKIFDHGHKTGETEQETLYAIFDKETGEPMWDSRTDSALTPDEYAHYQKTGVLKKLGWNVRHAVGIGKVFSDPRLKSKDATIEKMIRDAEYRARMIGDDFIEPAGVTDLGGIMHVLMDETALDGSKINRFIDMHKTLAKEKFGDGVKIEIADVKNGSMGQSDQHKFRRINILVPKEPESNDYYKIEMIFYPLNEYLRSEYRVGEIDPKTGIRKGQAHKLYEDIRSSEATGRMLPVTIFEPPVDINEVTRREIEKDVAMLQQEDQIPFGDLPAVFTEFDRILLANTESAIRVG